MNSLDSNPRVQSRHLSGVCSADFQSAVSPNCIRHAAVVLLLLASTTLAFAAGALKPNQLRCEYLESPLGIDTPHPRLSWIVESDKRAQLQTAYEIIVASSQSKLERNKGDLWQAGKILSADTAQIAYGGRKLNSGERCFWKVRVWDKDGKASNWSKPAAFEMGLLSPSDWQAKWIGRTSDTKYEPAPFLRRTFEVKGAVTQARVYVSGLGYYELRLNGHKVGNHLLDPGYTRYDKRVLYVTYDVTPDLRAGRNAIGAIIGSGWYNCHTRAVWNFHEAPWRGSPKLLVRLRIDYADGHSETVVSDEQWRTSTGPIVFDSIYGGENYDARLEMPGWDTADFNDARWTSAKVVDAPKGFLKAQMMPAIKALETFRPVKITEPKPGVFIVDFGQSFAGHAELKVSGLAATKIQMRYGERVNKDGMLDVAEIEQHVKRVDASQQYQTDTYTLKGVGEEKWHSRFTYHGFQYIEVTGWPGKPTLDSFIGEFTHSAIPAVGKFECSNELLNKIARAARYAYLSNLQGIPTDCPHREKNGWTGDAHLAAEQGIFNFEPAAVYTKWVNDLDDEQKPTGELPGIVPTSGWGYHWGNGPAWDSAFLLIPFYMYEYYGDTQILRDHFAGMKRYVDYLTSKATNGIVTIGLNDWAPFDTKTPGDITSTAYYYRDTQIVALAARLSGNEVEAKKYSALADQIKSDFNKAFYHPNTGTYGNGSQTSLSCALYQGLVEPENRGRVLANLVAAVERRHGHIDTGILGAKYIMNALLENDRNDVAYRMASQKDLPSWGWWIEQGATTLWEEWNGGASRNHIMYGDVVAWFYKALPGINPDPAAPGFKHFIIKPNLVGDLTFARAEYNCIRGRIVSDWKLVDDRLQLKVSIPANSSATVFIPARSEGCVKEGAKDAANAAGVRFVRQQNGCAVFEVGSGDYTFTVSK